MEIIKYPRTPHLEGSNLQVGDEGHDQVRLKQLRADFPDAVCIIEEKIDGANAGISFDADLNLRIQSRGHILTGGARERQFGPLKEWATTIEADLLERLEDRYTMYGEWCWAHHTQFYDLLPHYFLEFDILDRTSGTFLPTPARRALLEGLPISSVPVIGTDWPTSVEALRKMVGPSLYRSPDWRDTMRMAAGQAGVDPDEALRLTDGDLAEGHYIKIEQGDAVLFRAKFVRPGFVQKIIESGMHWSARPMIRNRLADARPDTDLTQEFSV